MKIVRSLRSLFNENTLKPLDTIADELICLYFRYISFLSKKWFSLKQDFHLLFVLYYPFDDFFIYHNSFWFFYLFLLVVLLADFFYLRPF